MHQTSGAGGARALYGEPDKFSEYSVNFTFFRRFLSIL